MSKCQFYLDPFDRPVFRALLIYHKNNVLMIVIIYRSPDAEKSVTIVKEYPDLIFQQKLQYIQSKIELIFTSSVKVPSYEYYIPLLEEIENYYNE